MTRLMVKADDLGISEAVTLGILSAHENGIVTMTGAMVNLPYSKKAAELSKNYKDLSVGLHVNLVLGTPMSSPEMIPSLVTPEGKFISSKQRRAEIKKEEDNFNYDDLVTEISKQVDQFIVLFGYLPEYIEGHAVVTRSIMSAIIEVAQTYKIKNLTYQPGEIHYPMLDVYEYYEKNLDFTNFLVEDALGILKHDTSCITFHPGFIDYQISRDSSLVEGRYKDHFLLTQNKTLDWIKDNKIQLINFRNL